MVSAMISNLFRFEEAYLQVRRYKSITFVITSRLQPARDLLFEFQNACRPRGTRIPFRPYPGLTPWANIVPPFGLDFQRNSECIGGRKPRAMTSPIAASAQREAYRDVRRERTSSTADPITAMQPARMAMGIATCL